MKIRYWVLSLFIITLIHSANSQEETTVTPLSVAVLDFQEKGESLEGMGEKVGILLGAFMSSDENLMLVERAQLETSLEEFELSLSGAVNGASAAKIGQLTGAKVIVTGRVFPVGKQTYIVAKVISVETSRVFGETAKFVSEDEMDGALIGLSEKIGQIVAKNRDVLEAKVETREEFLARLKKLIGAKAKGKKVFVSIPEQHISRAIPDPAVQTEMLLVLQQVGFDITEDKNSADIRITGEAFSERAAQRGQLISCRARAEIKRHDNTGELVSVDRHTEVAVDLAENIAAKSALQKAGLVLVERLIQALAKSGD